MSMIADTFIDNLREIISKRIHEIQLEIRKIIIRGICALLIIGCIIAGVVMLAQFVFGVQGELSKYKEIIAVITGLGISFSPFSSIVQDMINLSSRKNKLKNWAMVVEKPTLFREFDRNNLLKLYDIIFFHDDILKK